MNTKKSKFFILFAAVCLMSVQVSFSQLPDPWMGQDVGEVDIPGSSFEENGVFSITGSGGIWQPDAFHYVYQIVQGDVEIVAHLDQYTADVNEWTKVGLMIRGALEPLSKNVFLFSAPGPVGGTPWGTCMQGRLEDEAETSWLKTFYGDPFPLWQKLTKEGDQITAAVSTDGISWSTVATTKLTLEGDFYVGMAVASTMPNATVTAEFSDVTVTSSTGIKVAAAQVSQFNLADNYPNPFNPSTTIEFSLPENGPAKLSIFDIQGRELLTLVDQDMTAGLHVLTFDASELPSGILLYRLVAGQFTQTKKMMLIK